MRSSRAFTIKKSPEHQATKEAGSRAVLVAYTTGRCIILGVAVAVAWLIVLREALNISRTGVRHLVMAQGRGS